MMIKKSADGRLFLVPQKQEFTLHLPPQTVLKNDQQKKYTSESDANDLHFPHP